MGYLHGGILKEQYAKAIDILMSEEFDPRAILIELAKTNPAALIEAEASLRGSAVYVIERQVLEVYSAVKKSEVPGTISAKVEAIKKHRALTGSSLKASKDEVDAWEHKWIANGLVPAVEKPTPYKEPEF